MRQKQARPRRRLRSRTPLLLLERPLHEPRPRGPLQLRFDPALHDVHTQPRKGVPAKPKTKTETETRDPGNPICYRTLGALGKAFDLKVCPAVVLIDEIDKADIDFPNDLLTVLDDPWGFYIRETGENIQVENPKEHKPIVIITSNKEKGNLPAPFLRRCIYSYVEFPRTPEELLGIVNEHDRHGKGTKDADLDKAAAKAFLEIRGKDLHKKPGTSEFLDWLKALRGFDAKPFDATKLTTDKPPYPELLFKLRADYLKAS